MTPQERAEHSAKVMWERDAASKWLGITLNAIGPGTATVSLDIDDHHLNGHQICHGGYIFTLADSAFALACNSYNKLAVAQHNQIAFLSPGKKGEKLIAHAAERVLNGRSGIYDVDIVSSDGRQIALFRGFSRAISGQHFLELET